MINKTLKHKGLVNSMRARLRAIITKIVRKEDLVKNFNTKILRKYKNEKPLKIKKNKQGFIVQINSHYISLETML